MTFAQLSRRFLELWMSASARSPGIADATPKAPLSWIGYSWDRTGPVMGLCFRITMLWTWKGMVSRRNGTNRRISEQMWGGWVVPILYLQNSFYRITVRWSGGSSTNDHRERRRSPPSRHSSPSQRDTTVLSPSSVQPLDVSLRSSGLENRGVKLYPILKGNWARAVGVSPGSTDLRGSSYDRWAVSESGFIPRSPTIFRVFEIIHMGIQKQNPPLQVVGEHEDSHWALSHNQSSIT